MNFFKYLIKYKLKIKKDNKYKSVNDFTNYLTFLGYIGKIDEVYLSFRLLDKTYVDNNRSELIKYNVFNNLEYLVNKIENDNTYDIKKFFLCEEVSTIEIYNSITDFLSVLRDKEASHEENFVLNFLLNTALMNNSLSTDISINLVNHFWDAKNCNKHRKDYCIFSIVDFCISKNDREFFKLRKQFYNHIHKIYHQIYRSIIMDYDERFLYKNLINLKIKKINDLESQSRSKVAICISGIYRNHINGIKKIKNNLIDPLGADVFIHTWDEKAIWVGNGGSPALNRLFDSKARSLLPKSINNLSELQKKLPKTYDIIQHPISKKWDATEMTNILNPKKVLIQNQTDFEDSLVDKKNYVLSRGSLNQIKMFHGIKESFDLALNYSAYDYIIRIRPDTLISSKVSAQDIHSLENNVFYAGVGRVGPHDAHFTVSSSMAYSLTNLIGKMFDFNALSPYPEFPLYDSHNVLLAWLIESNYIMDEPFFKCNLLATSDRKIVVEGLANAIREDFNNLAENDKLAFLPFIKHLKNHYC